MSDCPTIRADCVSSNQVVVNWMAPGQRHECKIIEKRIKQKSRNAKKGDTHPMDRSETTECPIVDKLECSPECQIVEQNVSKKRRNRTRQKSLPANRIEDCIYVTDMPHYLTLIPTDNCHVKSMIPNGTTTKDFGIPPPPAPPSQFDGRDMVATSHNGSAKAVPNSNSCWQFEHRQTASISTSSCQTQKMSKKRRSIQAEAIQLDDEPPPPPPPPIFCGSEVYDRVLPPPPPQMVGCESDDIVAVVEDHRHRERRRPPLPAPQPKPRFDAYTNIFELPNMTKIINHLTSRIYYFYALRWGLKALHRKWGILKICPNLQDIIYEWPIITLDLIEYMKDFFWVF